MAQVEVKKIKLNNGIEVPMVGFGTFRAEDKDSLSRALKCAIRNGYRHIDTAWAYENEHIIGNTLQEIFEDPSYNVKRQDIFICSKVWNAFHSADLVRENLNDSLRKLKTSYLDLYLIHWPTGYMEHTELGKFPRDAEGNILFSNVSFIETYQALEKEYRAGKVKAIGLSNFNSRQIEEVFLNCEVRPAVNQIEVHPYLQNDALIEFCQLNNIVVEAYASIGAGMKNMGENVPFLLENETILKIAKMHNKSPAQVCLRWGIQRNLVVLVKSVTCDHVVENIKVFDFELSDEEMQEIKKINRNLRIYAVEDHKASKFYPFNLNEE